MRNLDATFSAANYRHIWDEHARRGRPLGSLIPEVVSLGEDLRKLRASQKSKLSMSSDSRSAVRFEQQREVDELLSRRRDALTRMLNVYALDASRRIRNQEYDLGLTALPPRNQKVVYRLSALDSPASYFLVKQIERNIREAFDVTMPNRHRMMSQVVTLLQNKTPKTLLKLDVASCFESISHASLREMLKNQPRLGQTTQLFLDNLISAYGDLTGKPCGLPRGVGISSFLAEAFLKTVDSEIRLMQGVTYYARYVDDIVIIVTDVTHDKRASEIRDRVTDSLRRRGLRRNHSKERLLSSTDGSKRRITLLGYEVAVHMPNGEASIDISKTRYTDYVDRLESAFKRYRTNAGAGAATALEKRVALLTSNQRLWRPGGFNSNGVRFSHKAMREPGARLYKLDQHLQRLILDNCSDPTLRDRLAEHSFVEGFKSVRFMRVSQRRRDQITSIWRTQ